MKIITFALTIFNPKKYEIDNYVFSFEKINELISDINKVDFLIISDNPAIDENTINYINEKIAKIENCKFIINNENLVRIGAVKKVQKIIDSKFIKFCDPDDFLIPEQTISMIEKLNNLTGDELVIYSYKATTKIPTIENFDKIKYKTFFWKTSYNPNTIYSANAFKKIKWDFKLLIWSDDLLGYLIWKEVKKIKYFKNDAFYINNRSAGVSTTKANHESLSFFNDSKNFINLSLENIENNYENRMFKKLTHKPNAWFLRQVANDLSLNLSLTSKEKADYFTEIYNESRKIKKYSIENKIVFKKQLNLIKDN